MTLSIVIPAYKAAPFIEECLNSVANQKCLGDFEIKVGIDGCHSTLKKLEQIRNNYNNLKLYWFEKNQGPYVVLNSLIFSTGYDKVIIFNADDIMLDGLVYEVYHNLSHYPVVRFCYQQICGSKVTLKKSQITANGVFGIQHKTFLDMNGFRGYRVGADSDFKERLIHCGIPIKNLKKKAYFIRRKHPDALTVDPKTGPDSEFRKNCKEKMKQCMYLDLPITVTSYREI